MTTTTGDAPAPAALERRPRARRDGGRDRLGSWLVLGVVLLATVLQPTGRFRFDARGYWNAAGSLLDPAVPAPEGFWDLRGVLSAVVYLPAQLVTRVLGADSAGFVVLVQNSLVIAAVAAFVAPALLRPWVSPGTVARWVMAAGVALACRGFAPYPLVDLYAAVAVLVAAVLLLRRSWWALGVAGLLLGCAFNIRPAYLVPVVLVGIVVVLHHRLRALAVGLGALVALVPQAVYQVVTHHAFGATPASSTGLIGIQAAYASYTVRYDTSITADIPQQFFCSPEMAARITEPPLTIGGLAETFLTTLPHSGLFALEKLGAALHWPLSTPYLASYPGVNALFAVLVTVMTVVGCAHLILLPVAPGRARIARPLLAVLVLGTAATLVSAATETRFALLLVLVGAIGLGALVERPWALRTRRADRWKAGGVAAVAALLLATGWIGLAHPAPPGGITVETCREDAR